MEVLPPPPLIGVKRLWKWWWRDETNRG